MYCFYCCCTRAFSQGLIKIGDRLITINHIDVTNYSVGAALALLKKCKTEVHLDIEYDVNIQGGQCATCSGRYQQPHNLVILIGFS